LGNGSAAWSALLAAALGALAGGNLAGGWLSDRVLPCGLIGWALAGASAVLLLLSQFYSPVMRWSAEQPLICGAILAALAVQAVPLGLLGSITPAILQQGKNAGGRWAGAVLAAGSGGGIAGALGMGLFLLPGLGLMRSYLTIAGILALAAFPAVWPKRRWAVAGILLVLLFLAVICWNRQPESKAVQSVYGQLEVRNIGLSRVLLIDGLPQTGLPKKLAPGDALRSGYLLEAALMMNATEGDSPIFTARKLGQSPIKRALVLGLGAGLAPRLLAAHGIDCETVEIDPKVVEIARQEFGFTGRVTITDGRSFLRVTSKQYDLIFLDVCTADRLAYHLFTVDALRTLRRRLSPEGMVVIQFIGDDGPWSASLGRTVEEVFGGTLMLATRRDMGHAGPRWIFAARGRLLTRQENLFSTLKGVQTIQLDQSGRLLTDDRFPAELDWARAVLEWRGISGENIQ
jgi:MFS family permease